MQLCRVTLRCHTQHLCEYFPLDIVYIFNLYPIRCNVIFNPKIILHYIAPADEGRCISPHHLPENNFISYPSVPWMLQPPHPKKILPIQDLLNGMSIDLQDVVATD